NDNRIALSMVYAVDNGASKPMQTIVLHGAQSGNSGRFVLENVPGGIGAAVVDDDDLMGNAVELELGVEMLDGPGDTTFLVMRRNYNRQQPQLLASGFGRARCHFFPV